MRRGFTIIELVMVIAILGILLGIVTTAAASSIKQARVRKADACCKIVQAGFETYYAQKGEWPGGMDSKVNSRVSNEDDDLCELDPDDVRDMMRDILSEYKQGNPCLDISGLFVSSRRGNRGSRDFGMDFMVAIRGTKKDNNGQVMKTSEMYFGYPESSHGYFRHFKVVYSIPADKITVSTQDRDW